MSDYMPLPPICPPFYTPLIRAASTIYIAEAIRTPRHAPMPMLLPICAMFEPMRRAMPARRLPAARCLIATMPALHRLMRQLRRADGAADADADASRRCAPR